MRYVKCIEEAWAGSPVAAGRIIIVRRMERVCDEGCRAEAAVMGHIPDVRENLRR